jgi:hypothetical protein
MRVRFRRNRHSCAWLVGLIALGMVVQAIAVITDAVGSEGRKRALGSEEFRGKVCRSTQRMV